MSTAQGARRDAAGPSGIWTILRHLLLAGAAAAICGGINSGYIALRANQSMPFAVLLGAGLTAMVGMLFGLGQGVAFLVLERIGRRYGWDAPPTMDAAGRERRRRRVASQHAWAVTVVIVLATMVIGYRTLIEASERIKEAALRVDVLVRGVGGALVVMALAVGLVVPLATRWFAAIDRRFGLPWPRSPLTRYVLFVAYPITFLILPMFVKYGVKLGTLATPLALIVFVCLQRLLWEIRLSFAWLPKASTRARWGAAGVGAVLIAASASVFSLYARWNRASEIATEGDVTAAAVELLQRITDVDRDGISSLFGGNDCAPFDASRAPSRPDIAQNGIDEDCDGVDAVDTGGMIKLRPFHGGLPKSKKKRFNVLLIVIDSLRADHVGSYGYKPSPTPHLDELAKDAWLFTRAYSQSSTTALSMPSMLSGRRPATMRWRGGYPTTLPEEKLLPAHLRALGYDTTIAVNRYVNRRLKAVQRPFQHVMSVPKGVDWHSGEYIISNVIQGVERARTAKKPFFITAHFDDVHHPYRAHRGRSTPAFEGEDKNIVSYDKCIANMDNMLRPLMSHLRNVDVWKDTIVIITSDHGEEFEEHGKTIHSQACYVESVHVPLIVRIPGLGARRVTSPVALVDIVPTLVEVLDVQEGAPATDGQSLVVPALTPRAAPRERPIFCSIYQLLGGRRNFFTRAVRTESHSLIFEVISDHVELYDLVNDPKETVNIAEKNPDVVGRLRGLLGASLTGNLWEARRFK